MGKALNESGRHIAFNMCEWGKENPWEWGDACAQSWRATGDHTGTWSSTKGIIKEIMAIPSQYTGKPYGWNGNRAAASPCANGGPRTSLADRRVCCSFICVVCTGRHGVSGPQIPVQCGTH